MHRCITALLLTLGTAALPLTVAGPAAARTTFEIRSDMHDKCLSSNGDNAEMQTCNDNGHCLDVRNGEPDAPAQVVGDCHGNANQRWNHDIASRELVSDENPQCLSIQNNGERRDGAGINMRNCRHADWQMWHFHEV